MIEADKDRRVQSKDEKQAKSSTDKEDKRRHNRSKSFQESPVLIEPQKDLFEKLNRNNKPQQKEEPQQLEKSTEKRKSSKDNITLSPKHETQQNLDKETHKQKKILVEKSNTDVKNNHHSRSKSLQENPVNIEPQKELREKLHKHDKPSEKDESQKLDQSSEKRKSKQERTIQSPNQDIQQNIDQKTPEKRKLQDEKQTKSNTEKQDRHHHHHNRSKSLQENPVAIEPQKDLIEKLHKNDKPQQKKEPQQLEKSTEKMNSRKDNITLTPKHENKQNFDKETPQKRKQQDKTNSEKKDQRENPYKNKEDIKPDVPINLKDDQPKKQKTHKRTQSMVENYSQNHLEDLKKKENEDFIKVLRNNKDKEKGTEQAIELTPQSVKSISNSQTQSPQNKQHKSHHHKSHTHIIQVEMDNPVIVSPPTYNQKMNDEQNKKEQKQQQKTKRAQSAQIQRGKDKDHTLQNSNTQSSIDMKENLNNNKKQQDSKMDIWKEVLKKKESTKISNENPQTTSDAQKLSHELTHSLSTDDPKLISKKTLMNSSTGKAITKMNDVLDAANVGFERYDTKITDKNPQIFVKSASQTNIDDYKKDIREQLLLQGDMKDEDQFVDNSQKKGYLTVITCTGQEIKLSFNDDLSAASIKRFLEHQTGFTSQSMQIFHQNGEFGGKGKIKSKQEQVQEQEQQVKDKKVKSEKGKDKDYEDNDNIHTLRECKIQREQVMIQTLNRIKQVIIHVLLMPVEDELIKKLSLKDDSHTNQLGSTLKTNSSNEGGIPKVSEQSPLQLNQQSTDEFYANQSLLSPTSNSTLSFAPPAIDNSPLPPLQTYQRLKRKKQLIPLVVQSSSTLVHVRQRVESQFGIQKEWQVFMWRGRVIDDRTSIADLEQYMSSYRSKRRKDREAKIKAKQKEWKATKEQETDSLDQQIDIEEDYEEELDDDIMSLGGSGIILELDDVPWGLQRVVLADGFGQTIQLTLRDGQDLSSAIDSLIFKQKSDSEATKKGKDVTNKQQQNVQDKTSDDQKLLMKPNPQYILYKEGYQIQSNISKALHPSINVLLKNNFIDPLKYNDIIMIAWNTLQKCYADVNIFKLEKDTQIPQPLDTKVSIQISRLDNNKLKINRRTSMQTGGDNLDRTKIVQKQPQFAFERKQSSNLTFAVDIIIPTF
ncbi:MAG: hypothetical protein EZS28_010319, partial [Streblomastix strix]